MTTEDKVTVSTCPRFMSINVRNWKNFAEVSVALPERAFLIGPNAIGKSNFLDVFRFLRDLTVEGGGLASALQVRGGISKVRTLYARAQSDIEIVTTIRDGSGTNWNYRLVFNQEGKLDKGLKLQKGQIKGPIPFVKIEQVIRFSANGSEEILLDRPSPEDRKDPQRLRQVAIGQLSENKLFRFVAEFLGEIEYLHMVPQLVKEGSLPNPNALGKDPFGRDLLEQIRDTSKPILKKRLFRVEEALKVVAPQLKELKLKPDDKGRPHLVVKFNHWRPQGAYQNEVQFSDGTLRLIGFLWSLQEGNGPLLLEEPELSLHPAIVRKLAPFIHRGQVASRNRQVILSTHSSDILCDPGIAAEEILLVQPSTEGAKIVVGASIQEVKALMESGVPASEAALTRTETPQLALFENLGQ